MNPEPALAAPSPDSEMIARVLSQLGCPPERCVSMASQLDKRAKQLALAKGRTYEEALSHLLALMSGGWAAKSLRQA